MPCPKPSDFNDLIVSLEAPVCEQLRKLGQLSKAVSDAYSCIYNENLTFTEAFAQKICAIGCGDVASTTPGGLTSTTTPAPAPTDSWLETEEGSYTLVVPGGVTSMSYVVVAGGGGGGGHYQPGAPYPGPTSCSGGGSGGMRVGSIAVTPGETLSIFVGGGTISNGYVQTATGGTSTIIRGSAIVVRAFGGVGGQSTVCSSGIAAIGGAGGTSGTGGVGTTGIAGANSTTSPCASGMGGSSVSTIGLAPQAGAGSNGKSGQYPLVATDGAILLTW